ncbi:MAG: hypothetical protein HKN32_05400 [Flavobacteriales bacterium]|nr:hypothetical protein [Flavobacteriales bacterium]
MMEKEILKNIATDKVEDSELKKFDQMVEKSWIGNPSSDFTRKVMNSLPSGDSFKIGLHVWGIIAGVSLVIILWGLGGFVTPEIKLSYQLPENLQIIETGTIELTQITKGFMVANALLLLLLLDRVIQRRNRAA